MTSTDKSLRIVLGDQLVPIDALDPPRETRVFMAEDLELCTRVRHHQQKLVLFLAAMRAYRDELTERGYEVEYHELERPAPLEYEAQLARALERRPCSELRHLEVDDRFMEARLAKFATRHGVRRVVLPSPKFLGDGGYFACVIARGGRPRMADFYRGQRRRLQLLLAEDGGPAGGKWSHDSANRQPWRRGLAAPASPSVAPAPHVAEVQALVKRRFADHPGNADEIWLPTTRAQALRWLEDFIGNRLREFGPYEDAISTDSLTLFHSVLSPALNLGLLTPHEVIERAVRCAGARRVPINSLEGFVRQIVGWREFVRGIDRHFGEQQERANFWGHERSLTEHWYRGTTGIAPLDDTIKAAERLGWTHHITRLMIVGNLMTLAEIAPAQGYRWFMEMYVDSADWVMGPNVYGMGLFSDGGVFATKPYVCGSNYLRKMSDYGRGEWCDVVDGLYWRFIDKHRLFFERQPRLALTVRALERLAPDRRARLVEAAERFLERCTGS